MGQPAAILQSAITGLIEATYYGPAFDNVAGSLSLIDASTFTGNLDIAAALGDLCGDEGRYVWRQGRRPRWPRVVQETIPSGCSRAFFDGKGDTIDGGAGENTLALYGGDLFVRLGRLPTSSILEVRGQGWFLQTRSLSIRLCCLSLRTSQSATRAMTATSRTWQNLDVVLNNLSADVAGGTFAAVLHGTSSKQ
ncbi:MAG: hypothetical protein R3E51_10455 [Rhizobiaceae bacterium]